MAANSKSITKADIANFRKLVEMAKAYHKIINPLSKKLDCEFFELSEWVDDLGRQPTVTDEDICYAMGRLSR